MNINNINRLYQLYCEPQSNEYFNEFVINYIKDPDERIKLLYGANETDIGFSLHAGNGLDWTSILFHLNNNLIEYIELYITPLAIEDPDTKHIIGIYDFHTIIFPYTDTQVSTNPVLKALNTMRDYQTQQKKLAIQNLLQKIINDKTRKNIR